MRHYCIKSLCDEDFVIPRHEYVLVLDTLDLSVERIRGEDVFNFWNNNGKGFINISAGGGIMPSGYDIFDYKWGKVSTNHREASLYYRDKVYWVEDFLDTSTRIVLEQIGGRCTDNVLIKRTNMDFKAKEEFWISHLYLRYNNLWLSDDGDGLKFSMNNFTDLVANSQGLFFSDCKSWSLNEALDIYLCNILAVNKKNLALEKIIRSLEWLNARCSLESVVIKGYLDYIINTADFRLFDEELLHILVKLAESYGYSKEVKARLSKKMFLSRDGNR